MDRNNKMALVALIAFFLSTACSSSVTNRDVAGTWYNKSGASIIIKLDGSFSGKKLPGGNVIWPSKDFAGFNGYGHWKLGEGNKEDVLVLEFDNNPPGTKQPYGMKEGFITQLYLDRSNGLLYIFGWVAEEGGERFRFDKIK